MCALNDCGGLCPPLHGAPVNGKKYLYLQVYEALKNDITRGVHASGALLPSEREIGECFGVDRTTVRKALECLVDDGLVAKHAGVGSKVVDFSRCEGEQGLRRAIAFFLPRSTRKTNRISQPFYASIFYHLEQECRRQHYALAYSTLDSEDDFPAMIEASHYAGIVFLSNVDRRFIDHACMRRVPSVLINDVYAGITSINSDNIGGMQLVCAHLLAQGHTRFGFVTGIDGYLTTRERMMACIFTLGEAGLRIQDQVIEATDWEPDSGYAATKRILARPTPPPTALIAFNDSLALGCMRALYEEGLRIPDDISLVGFDDLDQAKNAIPALTSVHQHLSQIAQAAMHSLRVQIDSSERDSALRLTVPCSLSVRDSTAPPRER